MEDGMTLETIENLIEGLERGYLQSYVETTDGVASLHIPDVVDLYTAPVMKEFMLRELDDPAVDTVRVEFDNVEFLGSTALGVLVGGFRRARTLGKNYEVTKPTDRNIGKIFEITGLDRLFWPDSST